MSEYHIESGTMNDVLFVGDHLEAGRMERALRNAGIKVHAVSTVKDAESFLTDRKTSEGHLTVVVQPNPAVISSKDTMSLTPEIEALKKRFGQVDAFERGELFVQYARETGLLPQSVPVYLLTLDNDKQPPQGFNGVIEQTMEGHYERMIATIKRTRRSDERSSGKMEV